MMRLLSILILCLITLPAGAANLVPNSSFEIDRGWISYGSIPKNGSRTNSPNRIVTTNDAAHGNRVMTLASESAKSKPIPLLPGTYSLTFSARGGPTGNERLYWRVVGERGANLNPLTLVTTTTSWTRFTNTVSITSVSNYIVVLGEGNGWPVIVDAVMLETGSVASAFSPIPIEFGFSTTNLDNTFMAGETPAVGIDFWNNGAETNASAVWKIYDLFNRTVATTTNTLTLAPNSKTSTSVLLPTTNAYLRLHGYISSVNSSWDETAVTVLPYARGSLTADTNGVLGTHSHISRYHSSGNRQLGFKWNRGLSVSQAILWSTVQPTSGAMDWTTTDPQVHGASTNGQVLLMSLHGWPTWAVDGAGNPSNNLWINFVTNAVDRYRNYVWFWEIPTNEPDNPAENNGWTTWQTYSNLSRLIADTAAAVKAFQPTGYVVAMVSTSDGDYGYQVYTNMTVGERANIDAVSGHYYPQDHGFDPNEADDDYGHLASVYKWRRNFIEGSVKPVWNTESGIWFGTGFKGDGMFYGPTFYEPNEPSSSYTPEVKRNDAMARVTWRVDMILHAAARSLGWGMKRYFYYDARYPNIDHISFANPTIYEFNGSLKPNGAAILNMQHYLGVGIDRITNQSSANIEAYLFPHSTFGNVIAAWNLDRTNRTLTFTNSQILVLDAMGSGIQTNSLTAGVTRNLRYYISGSLTQNQLSNTFKYASVADAADTAAPNVSIDASPIGPVDGSRTLFKWSGDEDTSLPWYQNNHDTNIVYKYRFQPGSSYSDLSQSNHVWATFGPGVYNLDVVAYDAKGNASQAVLGPTFTVNWITNFTQYNFAQVSQGTQAVSFNLSSNLYTVGNTKVERSTDGGLTFTEMAWQPGSSNTIIVSTDIGVGNASTNIFQMTAATPTTYSGFGYLTWETNGGAFANTLFTVTNGYTGLKVVNTNAAITGEMFPLADYLLANGVWVFTTNRVLMHNWPVPTTNMLNATNITVEVVEAGPVLAYFKVRQLFSRPDWFDGTTLYPAGTGTNIVEIKIEAHRPIVEIRESSDAQLGHEFVITDGVTNANQLRFRNGDTMNLATWEGRLGYLWGQATNDAVIYGYDVLKDWETGLNIDWVLGSVTTNSSGVFYTETWPNAQQGGTGHTTSGSWWVFDNTNGSVATAPLFGVGNAHMSSARGAGTGALGFHPFRYFGGRYGIRTMIFHRDGPGNVRTNSSIHYFLYTGLRTNITNSASTYYWDMTREFAKMNGVGALSKQVASDLDPALLSGKTDWGTFTQTRVQLTNLLNRLRGGEANLSNFLVAADSVNADLVRALADSSGYSTLVLITNIFNNASNFFGAHWERDAMLETPYNFLQGGQLMGREAVRIDAANMLATFDTISSETLFKLRWLGLIYSRAMFDQDIYPMDNILAGLYLGSLGTASMPTEYINFRSEYSTWLEPLATNGLYTSPQVISTVHGGLSQSLNEYGASIASPHYTLARVVPYMENIMMLSAKGTTNLMLDTTLHSKFTNFAEFMFSLQTTVPEPRFSSTNRYRTSMGDGELSRAAIYGQIDTVLRVTDPPLASRSKQSWIEQGKPLNAYFQPGFLTVYIDETVTANPPQSRHTSGYLSSLRTRIGTGYEGAVWLMNGTFPNDHINYVYAGAPSFYLLGAPIGPERTPYPIGFNPTVSSPMYRSSVVPTNAVIFTNDLSIMPHIGWAWDSTPTNTLFAAFRYSGVADTRMTKSNDIYVTTVALVSPSPTFDVLLIDDRFTNQLERHYITTSLNVTGDISGTVSATTPTYTYPSSFPQLGSTNWIGPGFAIFSWTNASWPNHVTGGAHIQTGAHLKSESNAVYSAYWDTTSAYEPKRDLYLRFEGSNNAARVVVARKPTAGVCTITTNATGFNIVNGSEEMWVATNNWEYSLGTQTNAAAVLQGTGQFVSTNGIGISGGQAEVYLTRASTTNISVSASGEAGLRTITNSTLPYPLVVATDGHTSRTIGIRRQ